MKVRTLPFCGPPYSEKKLARHRVRPWRMELANFRSKEISLFPRNNVNISQERFRLVHVGTNLVHSVHVHVKPPNKKIQDTREPPFNLCLKQARLLFALPSSVLVIGSFSLGSPIVDIYMVKPRLGTGVPRFPESDAPKSSFHAPPFFSLQPTCSGYLL